MKRKISVIVMLFLFVLSMMSTAVAAGNVKFKTLYMSCSNGKIVVQGQFSNYGNTPATIDSERLAINYTAHNDPTQKVSGTEQFDNLNLPIKPNEVKAYSFTCNNIQALPVGKWHVTPHTTSH